MTSPTVPLEERIRRRVIVAKASFLVRDACHLWQGARTSGDRGGYGLIKIPGSGDRGVPVYVHRVVYEAEVGPIPEGMTLDHLCEIRNCVNPAHLEPVSVRENVTRTFRRRRLAEVA